MANLLFAVAAAAAANTPFQRASALLAMGGTNYSAACVADRERLQKDQKVFHALMPVLATSTAVVMELISDCSRNTTKCTTRAFGELDCCTADGESKWVMHEAKVDAFEAACKANEKGDLVWFVENVTASYVDPLQSVYKHTLPLFVGKDCQNDADMAILLDALSQDCTARRPVRSCHYSRPN